jgi:ABC-type sugar transport system substrate-binding protein
MDTTIDRAGPVALVAALGLTLAACGTGADQATAEGGGGGNTIVYLQALAADPSVQSVTAGMQCAAKKSGDEVVLFDAGFDQSKQIGQFDTAMTQQADAIVSHAVNSPGMYPSYARAAKAGIPVIDYAGPSDEPPDATYVGEDQAAVAQTTVDALLATLPSGGKAVMIGGPPQVAGVKPRADEFRAAAEAAGIEVLGQEDSLTLTTSDIQGKASSLLLKHPDANIVWGVTAQTAATAGQVARAQGLAVGTDVVVIGAGASADVADQVRQGALTYMVDNLSYEWGEAMVSLMDEAVDGKPISNPSFTYKAYDREDIDTWIPPDQRCDR